MTHSHITWAGRGRDVGGEEGESDEGGMGVKGCVAWVDEW